MCAGSGARSQGRSVLQELRASAAEAPCPPPTHSKGEPVPQTPREGLERGLEPESRGREALLREEPQADRTGALLLSRGPPGSSGAGRRGRGLRGRDAGALTAPSLKQHPGLWEPWPRRLNQNTPSKSKAHPHESGAYTGGSG